MMSPPRPPSPPSGPPAATNFSRWKLTAPSPPLPAWSQMVAMSIKLVCAAIQALLFSEKILLSAYFLRFYLKITSQSALLRGQLL
jgi:hypothetical protein